MAKKQVSEEDQVVYVRFPPSLVRRLDKRVTKERRERAGLVDSGAISRSSVIRSAVAKLLEEST